MDDTENIVTEEIVSDEEMGNPQAVIKKLKEKIKGLEAEKQEYLLGWQRAKADFVNARKNDAKEREEFTKFSKEGVLKDLLSVADSFDMAFGNKESWEKVDKNWRTGVESIYSQLLSAFQKHGLTQIGVAGEKFDPRNHAPVATVAAGTEEEDDTVADVIQKGYALEGKVIRPAKVRIKQFEDTN